MQDKVATYKYLREDLHVRCSDGGFTDLEYDTITSIAFALIFVWPVGMVLLLLAALVPCRASFQSHTQTKLTKATQFLWRDYKVCSSLLCSQLEGHATTTTTTYHYYYYYYCYY